MGKNVVKIIKLWDIKVVIVENLVNFLEVIEEWVI